MANSPTTGRRCLVTLLFTDLCDYTSLNEACDPEDVAELMTEVKAAYQEVITHHGGIVNQIYGDGVLALFGYPSPSEADARKAVSAALDLHTRVRSLSVSGLPQGFTPRLHTGIHAGLIFVGIGGSVQGRYNLTGDAINTAARLASAAGEDEIFVTESSLSGDINFFKTEAMAPLSLKGKQEPVHVVRVTGHSEIRTRFEARAQRGLTPFVGRTRELVTLRSALTRTRGGTQELWILVGAPGIGKSRLLEQMGHEAQRGTGRVLSGTCEVIGPAVPFQPFIGVLQQLFQVKANDPVDVAAPRLEAQLRAIDPQLPSNVDALMQALGLTEVDAGTDAESAQKCVRDAVTSVLAALIRQEHLLLILDDWQWADDPSRQLLDTLLASTGEQGVMLMLGSREQLPPPAAARHCESLTLSPFQTEESLAAIRSLSAQFAEIGFATTLHDRCGGNPLFLEELCRALSESGQTSATLENVTIPTTIHGLIRARLSALPLNQIELLQVASVFGPEFELSLLQAVHETEDLLALIQTLVASDWIFAAGTDSYRFKHGISREVAYESVLLTERRRLHDLILQQLLRRQGSAQSSAQHETLAYHAVGSNSYEPAATYAELAGDRAAGIFALDSARKHFRASLDALDRLAPTLGNQARWVAISCKWAAACVYNPAPNHLETLDRARTYATQLSDLNSLAHVEYWCGWIHYALGEHNRAIARTQQALEVARRCDNLRLVNQLLLNLGQCQAAASDYQTAVKNLEEGLSGKRQRTSAPSLRVQVGSAYAQGYLALIAGDLGNFAAAYTSLAEAESAIAGSGHAVEGALLAQRGMIELWQGDFSRAARTAERMRTTAERVNGRYIFAVSRVVSGFAQFMLDESLQALMELREGSSWLDTHSVRLNLGWAYGLAAEAFARAGNIEAARSYAELALGRSPLLDRLGEISAYRTLARVAMLDSQDDVAARRHLARAQLAARARRSRREQLLTRFAVFELGLDVGPGAHQRRQRLAAAVQQLGMLWPTANQLSDASLHGE